MPPTPTQNLNAKLTVRAGAGRARVGRGARAAVSAPSASLATTRIVGAASRYRGGYHLSGR